MSGLQIALIAVAFVVAGIAKGAIGMGMPPIAIGLMSFALPLESAIAIMVVPTMVTNVWQAIYGGAVGSRCEAVRLGELFHHDCLLPRHVGCASQ